MARGNGERVGTGTWTGTPGKGEAGAAVATGKGGAAGPGAVNGTGNRKLIPGAIGTTLGTEIAAGDGTAGSAATELQIESARDPDPRIGGMGTVPGGIGLGIVLASILVNAIILGRGNGGIVIGTAIGTVCVIATTIELDQETEKEIAAETIVAETETKIGTGTGTGTEIGIGIGTEAEMAEETAAAMTIGSLTAGVEVGRIVLRHCW